MISQPYGPGLGKVDCESFQDFLTYYRNRYFAIQSKQFLMPAWLMGTTHRESDVQIQFFNPGENIVTPMATNWETLKKEGQFGHPMLGTFPHGPSYVYAEQSAVRESTKGVAPSRLVFWSPLLVARGRTVKAFLNKNPQLERGISGNRFGDIAEVSMVSELYNKRMYTFQEALDELGRGRIIGANVSNKIGLYLEEASEEIQVSYKNKHVGELRNGLIHLEPKYTHLSEIIEKQLKVAVR